jgi:two-component system cell cycle sensor histidine kinase/response regulator CckA
MQCILLVEDDSEVRQLIGEMLRRRGYLVVEAGSGAEALEVARRDPHPIGLLIADVVMPGMCGPRLAEMLTAVLPEIKVLYISGYPEERLRFCGVSYGEPNFLAKPFTQSRLISKLEEVLKSRPTAVEPAGVV